MGWSEVMDVVSCSRRELARHGAVPRPSRLLGQLGHVERREHRHDAGRFLGRGGVHAGDRAAGDGAVDDNAVRSPGRLISAE